MEELLKTPVVRVAGAGWSSWESWSTCSQSCAKGYRTRRRSCSGPEGKSAPVACRGSPVEYQDCNVQACPGESRQTPETPHGSTLVTAKKKKLQFDFSEIMNERQLLSTFIFSPFISSLCILTCPLKLHDLVCCSDKKTKVSQKQSFIKGF